jgi:hypothetical protein
LFKLQVSGDMYVQSNLVCHRINIKPTDDTFFSSGNSVRGFLKISSENTNDLYANGLLVSNSNTLLTSHAIIGASVEANGGSPWLSLDVKNASGWSIGVDNTDSQKLKIKNSTSFDANEFMCVTSDGRVGIGTSTPNASLQVYGSLSKTTGTFDIKHPDPEKQMQGYRLRHSFVESPTSGDNIYRYSIATKNKQATVQLPSYFKFLNDMPQVWVSAEDVMGFGKGKVDASSSFVNIDVSIDGTYNVLIIGTRKYEIAKKQWKGVEVEKKIIDLRKKIKDQLGESVKADALIVLDKFNKERLKKNGSKIN